MKALSRSQRTSDLTWSDVVEDATRCNEYSSLTPEDSQQHLTGFQKPVMEVLDEHVVAAVTPEAKPRRKTSSVHLNFNTIHHEATSRQPTSPKVGGY